MLEAVTKSAVARSGTEGREVTFERQHWKSTRCWNCVEDDLWQYYWWINVMLRNPASPQSHICFATFMEVIWAHDNNIQYPPNACSRSIICWAVFSWSNVRNQKIFFRSHYIRPVRLTWKPWPLMKAQRAWGSGILIFLVSLSYRHPHPTNTWDEFMHENGSLFMRAPGCGANLFWKCEVWRLKWWQQSSKCNVMIMRHSKMCCYV